MKTNRFCFGLIAATCFAAACSGDPSDGPTVATNRTTISTFPNEACEAPVFEGPERDYFSTPPSMLDWTPTESDGSYTTQGFRPRSGAAPTEKDYKLEAGFIGANDGRLRADLRAVAKQADPIHALCLSAQNITQGDEASLQLGSAFADLSVTGKATFKKFVASPPTLDGLRAAAECAGASDMALQAALRRAYDVAAMLRSGTSMQARRELGWIAVSGEDDQPHRPVNVPSATLNAGHYQDGRSVSFPQHDLTVTVAGKPSVATRAMIAHANPPMVRHDPKPMVNGGPGYRLPPAALPTLAPDAEVILFIHGMDSRLEEAMDLTKALHEISESTGKNWTVVSFDLPTSGYADNIDHLAISSFDAINVKNNRASPLVDYIEDFIVAFVDQMEREIPNVSFKSRIRAIVGGSLGGNMSMRLGRRAELNKRLGRVEDLSWIRNVVPWSPAAIWPSFANDTVGQGGHVNRPYSAVTQSLKWAGSDGTHMEEQPQRRMEMFYGGFDWRPAGAVGRILDPSEHKPQSELWYSDLWSCKQRTILGDRLDRHETYDANFRRWHWRLAAEQLLFSQQETFPAGHHPSKETPALYTLNTTRMFLSCGELDVGGALCNHTRDVAAKMENTPGYFKFVKSTGHAIDNERPRWMANEIADFLRE